MQFLVFISFSSMLQMWSKASESSRCLFDTVILSINQKVMKGNNFQNENYPLNLKKWPFASTVILFMARMYSSMTYIFLSFIYEI